MPFTFSHPAVVLPLSYLPKRMISMTALVIGSITPDFEYFIRMRIKSTYSHTWPGLFWYDLPLALILFFLYQRVVKDELIDHLPILLNRRLSAFKGIIAGPYNARQFIVMVICILAGASSHILWDGFTHPSGQFVKTVPLLKRMVHAGPYRLHLYNLLQHISTVTGGLIVLLSVILMPKQEITQHGGMARYWLIVLAVCVAVVSIRLKTGLDVKQYGDAVVSLISGGLTGLIIASILTPKTLPLKTAINPAGN